MAEYIDFEGKTTQEALDVAVEKTGVSPSNLKFEIINPGGTGIFGISFKKAKIRVFLEEAESGKEEKKPRSKKSGPKKDGPKKSRAGKEPGKKEKKADEGEAGKPLVAEKEDPKPAPAEPPAEPAPEEIKEEKADDGPPRSTWARPTKKADLPKKEKKNLTPEDLVKPAIPKDRIDVDLRDERDIRRAERNKRRSRERTERPERGRPARRSGKPQDRVKIPKNREAESNDPPQDIEDEHREMAAQALKEILSFWMDEAAVESGWREGKIYLNIIGDGSGLLIGRKGQTLDAIQFIVGKIVDKNAGRHLRLMIDTENYRKRREQSLERTAVQLAEKALSSRKGQTTGPMNPHDRRIIHLTLQEDGRFKTRSRGEGTYKRVLISLK